MQTRRSIDKGALVGVLLVGLGALFLLQTFGIMNFVWRTTIGLAFLGGAAAFLAVFAGDRRQWWAVFPAAGLTFVGLTIFIPHLGGLAGTILFLALGAAFLTVHVVHREWFWPIIPGGVMLTLAAVTFISTLGRFGRWINTGGIFFLGLAATFAAVWFVAENKRNHYWALIVAGVLGIIGMLSTIGSLMRILIPVGLILLGVYALTENRKHS